MKKTSLLPGLLTLLGLTLAAHAAPGANCGCSCCKDRPKGEACCCNEPAKAETAAAVKRYPLKGVITSVLPDRSALMVKHEEIPGFMRAMTMMFKVDAATLKSAKKGDAITGMMSRQGDDWVLEEVRPAKAK
ncbi:MAG: copper-binding protein [Opitutaceae bacterium]